MFEKNMKIAYLIDFYEDLLDPHVSTVMRAYYDDDLSLAEVASGVGISRQGVRHVIKRGEERLDFLEEKLSLARRHERTEEVAERLREISLLLRSSDTNPASLADELDALADSISENN